MLVDPGTLFGLREPPFVIPSINGVAASFAANYERNQFAINSARSNFGTLHGYSRVGNATQTDASGVVSSVAANVPRMNDFSVGRGAYLHEGARSNVIPFSDASQGAGFTINGVTIALLEARTINGVAGWVYRCTGTASANGGDARSLVSTATITALANENWAQSIYAQVVRGSVVGGGGIAIGYRTRLAGASVFFDRQISSLQTQTNFGRRTAAVTLPVTVIDSIRPEMEITTTNGGVWDTDVWIGGLQFERNARFVSSLIPTNGAAADRFGDVCPTLSFASWYNSTAMTIVAEFTCIGTPSNNVQAVYEVNDNTPNNAIKPYISTNVSPSTLAIEAKSGGAAQFNENYASVIAAGALQKVAFALELNNFAACRNGGVLLTDALGTMPTGVDRMAIGNNFNSTEPAFIAFHVINGFPTRIPNAQVQAVTT